MADNKETMGTEIEQIIRNSFKSYNRILREALKCFPNKTAKEVTFFSPVYYPIAILNVGAEEESFTDFKGFEITVLKLIDNGVTEISAISKLLGLTENYVKKILSMMTGIGYINEDGITRLGKESIQENKKKAYHHVTHAVQVNAINSEVVSLKNLLKETDLDDKFDTVPRIHHFRNIDRIERDRTIQEIIKDYSQNLSTEDLHVNIRRIDEIYFKELKYTKCYAIRFNSDPIVVLMNRKTAAGRNNYNNFTPVGIEHEEFREIYGLNEDVPLYSQNESNMYNDFYARMLDDIQSIPEDRAADEKEALSIILSPNLNNIIQQHTPNKCESIYYVNAEDFIKVNNWMLSFIQDISNNNASIIGRDSFRGRVIKLLVEDNAILKATELLKEKNNGIIDRTLRENLFSETDGLSGKKLWEKITSVIEDNNTDYN